MSSILDKLLKGQKVEWLSLGEVCLIADNLRKPVKSSLRVAGDTPYYGANNIQDYVEGYTHDGEYVLIAEDGSASLENYSIQWVEGKFWANNHVHVVKGKEKLKSRFLFHFLRFMNFIPYLTGGDRAKLTKAKMVEILIPIPPLDVQAKIVKILDAFTALTAELTAELTMREKQYHYYRDKLLTFSDDEVEWKTLGEVANISSGGTPSKTNDSYWLNGDIPWLKSEVCKNCIVDESKTFITNLGLKNSSAKFLKVGTVLMAMVGATIFKTAYLTFEATTNQNIAAIKSKSNLVLDKYIFYFLINSYDELTSKLEGYNMINLSQIKLIKIPIPSLKEQKRIIAILDKFEMITNSITEGLPKEIALRQKQYEYYREQLLDFPKIAKEY
nr:restriction endonuclease subunit S [uncultured Moraxella sp.]